VIPGNFLLVSVRRAVTFMDKGSMISITERARFIEGFTQKHVERAMADIGAWQFRCLAVHS
jgi:hypothetical protein